MSLSPGTRLARYEVRALLGAGGMGEVYAAYDPDLEREVAIKVLHHGAAAELVQRFVQEARAASALNHPNVAQVYEIGSQDDLRFIVMEIVEGETLRAHLARGPLPAGDSVDIALQITAALAAAHKAGIVHRDLKPENVIVGSGGHVKVLDFGLAKLREVRGDDAATILKTRAGVVMGTIGYMAPELFSGSEVTPAVDVFSLGVVLYEMVHGHRPDGAKTGVSVPHRLEEVIAKALASSEKDRYPTAVELHEALRKTRTAERRPPLRMFAAIAILAVMVTGAWIFVRSKRQKTAAQLIVTAERLVAERKLPEAYDAANAAAAIVPADDRVREVITKTTEPVTITTEPPGATIWLQRFKGPAERVPVGTTPVKIPRLVRADYIVTVEKPGYATVSVPLPISPIYNRDFETRRMPGTRDIKLIESSRVPPRMVFVGGGEYRLSGWERPSDRAVNLHDFFIDQYEVSNGDFAGFVRAGGYRRKELWKHPFVLDGKPVSFEVAMSRLRDSTGLPGPRSWSGGAPPAGRENYPVTDVTWYEAAAFAEWSGGKQLPTIFEWEKAARYPETRVGNTFPWGIIVEGVDATERANFLGKGTVPVGSNPFGMSFWGAYNLAGNVSEWCRNPNPPGYAARGGSWDDRVYAFGLTTGYPPFYSSDTVGFRCVKDIAGGDQGGFALSSSGVVPVYKPVDDRTYARIRARYDYARTPLDARVIEVLDAPDWRRETINYSVAGKTALAYLYLPKGFRRPLQVVHFTPAGDVESGNRSLAASIESNQSSIIRSGRAVFSVALEGYVERPRKTALEELDQRTTEYADYTIARVTELRRGLDYLETRPEIDASRIAFVGLSAGSETGVILTAVDKRYRSVMFIGSGIEPGEVGGAEAADRINFAPHIAAPKLMLHGRYDEGAPLKSQGEPLFALLREPKRLIVFEGPHATPRAVYVRETQKWFDETLGKVGQ